MSLTLTQRQARVLVIEDDPSVRLLIEFYLVRAGYEVKLEKTGRDGIDQFGSFDPDAVVLDLNLPDITGVEVLREIRDQDGERHRVVVVLSGSPEGDSRLNLLRTEADSVEPKPIALSRLIRRLGSLNVPPRLSVEPEVLSRVNLY